MKKVSLLFFIALIVISSGAYASGLAIPEQGAAAMGMSAAVTARSEDLSALYYNPSGIDYVENTEVLFGITPIMPNHKFSGTTESEDSKKLTFVPPNLYAARRLSERIVVGLGMFTPYGLGTDWSEEWAGRYTSTYAEIRSIYITPAISIKIFDMLSFGFSYSWIWSDAAIQKKIDSGLALYGATAAVDPASADPTMIANSKYDSEFSLDGDGGGVSYTFGLMFRPFNRLQVGLMYTGESELTYKGEATFNHPAANSTMLSASMPNSQNGEAYLNLPSSLNLGVKLDITSAWDAEVDLNFVNWSSYNELVIDLAKDLPRDKLIQDKKWDDVTTIRIGTSYDLNDDTILRFGFLSDNAPVPDATFDAQLPDNDRIGFSVGVGRNITIGGYPLHIDASYLFLKFSDRDKNNFVGYQDVGSLDADTGLPVSLKDDMIDAADKAILDNITGALGRGEYPVANGSYEGHANLFSISASYKF